MNQLEKELNILTTKKLAEVFDLSTQIMHKNKNDFHEHAFIRDSIMKIIQKREPSIFMQWLDSTESMSVFIK